MAAITVRVVDTYVDEVGIDVKIELCELLTTRSGHHVAIFQGVFQHPEFSGTYYYSTSGKGMAGYNDHGPMYPADLVKNVTEPAVG